MKKRTKERIEIFSIVLSVLAILISFVSFGYTIYKDTKDSSEQISILNSGFGYDETLLYDTSGYMRGQGIIDGINYSITISNNSKQKVSIVDYELFRQTNELTYSYNNIVKQIKDSDNKPISLPIVLDAGESVLVTYEINTIVPQTVNMLLLEEFGVEGEISIDELRDYLGENSLDIFGNTVEYTKFFDGNYSLVIDEPNFPVYNLKFLTSKGNWFQCELSHKT